MLVSFCLVVPVRSPEMSPITNHVELKEAQCRFGRVVMFIFGMIDEESRVHRNQVSSGLRGCV